MPVLAAPERVVARRPRSLVWARPPPQPERDRNGIDVDPCPPRRPVAVAMQFAMMRATDRDRVFIAHLSSERAGLRESKMMRVGRRAAAHDAGLAGYESGVLLIAQANGLAHDSAVDGQISSGTSAKAPTPFLTSRPGSGSGATWPASLDGSCASSPANASSFTVKRLSTSCPSGFVSRFLSGIRR